MSSRYRSKKARQRRKLYLQELETKVKELEEENQRLKNLLMKNNKDRTESISNVSMTGIDHKERIWDLKSCSHLNRISSFKNSVDILSSTKSENLELDSEAALKKELKKMEESFETAFNVLNNSCNKPLF